MNDRIIHEIWRRAQSELEDHHYVCLWDLVSSVRSELPEADDRRVKDAVLAMIDQGLRRHEADAGLGAVPGGLESVWSEPVDQIVDRIRREWDELGRDPTPGEIVWFQKPGLDHAAEAQVIASPTQRYVQADGSQVFVQRFLSRLAHDRGWSPN